MSLIFLGMELERVVFDGWTGGRMDGYHLIDQCTHLSCKSLFRLFGVS